MKNFLKLSYSIGLCAAIIMAFSPKVMATDSAFSGTVSPINTLSLSTSPSSLTFGSSTALGTFTIDNNNRNGYTIAISSLNSGVLKRSGTSGKTADTVSYTVSTTHATGTWGASFSNLSSTALTTTSNISLSSVDVPTVGGQLAFTSTIPASTNLFSGTYGDTITVTVTNN